MYNFTSFIFVLQTEVFLSFVVVFIFFFFAERINHFRGNLSIYEALKHKIHAIFTLFSPQRRFRRNIWKILCLVRPNFSRFWNKCPISDEFDLDIDPSRCGKTNINNLSSFLVMNRSKSKVFPAKRQTPEIFRQNSISPEIRRPFSKEAESWKISLHAPYCESVKNRHLYSRF